LPPAWSQALAQLHGNPDASGWIRLEAGDPWEAVLRVALGTRMPLHAAVTVYRQVSQELGGGAYQRLWDRTEDLAGALTAWRAGESAWPRLQPGELVRLIPGSIHD
jgi:3-methyladenine DNA glycosylase/8-oxoguanine DNA glycosylase